MIIDGVSRKLRIMSKRRASNVNHATSFTRRVSATMPSTYNRCIISQMSCYISSEHASGKIEVDNNLLI